MPLLSVWAVRLSLLYFVAGTAVGSLLLAGKAIALPGWLWALRAAHVEALLFGFMVQLAFGVAFWILPRVSGGRGGVSAWVGVGLLNAGVWLVAAGPAWGGLAVAGRLSEGLGVAVFAIHMWPRVRAVGRPT